jgi:TolB-like protein
MSGIAVLGEPPAAGKIAVIPRQVDREPAIRQQLAHMLKSKVFVQSERLSRFLRFIVEQVLGGNQSQLKEYLIGSEVYDRKPPYHPSQDSIVRTEARRLRNKLKEYYETEGKNDSVYVYLRPGNYIPVFQYKENLAGVPCVADTEEEIAIAIRPFLDISERPLSARYSRGIPDELTYVLMGTEGCRVVSAACPAQIAFEGSVRQEGNRIRVTASIVDAAGVHLWTTRVDAETSSDSLFLIEEQIASTLSGGFHALCATGARGGSTRHAALLSPVSRVP